MFKILIDKTASVIFFLITVEYVKHRLHPVSAVSWSGEFKASVFLTIAKKRKIYWKIIMLVENSIAKKC